MRARVVGLLAGMLVAAVASGAQAAVTWTFSTTIDSWDAAGYPHPTVTPSGAAAPDILSVGAPTTDYGGSTANLYTLAKATVDKDQTVKFDYNYFSSDALGPGHDPAGLTTSGGYAFDFGAAAAPCDPSSPAGCFFSSGTLSFEVKAGDTITVFAGTVGDGYRSGTGGVTLFFDSPLTSAAPEPATWALFITGVGLLGGALRSRRRIAGTPASV